MNRNSWMKVFAILLLAAALTGVSVAAAQGAKPVDSLAPQNAAELGESPSPAANTVESEPNNSFASADKARFGDVISGKIGSVGDVDTFRIRLEKKTAVLVDIDAVSIGSALDPEVCLIDASSGSTICNDDTDTVDSLVFHQRYPRDYYITVADHAGTHGGRNHFYRLIVSSPLLVSAATAGTVAGIPFEAADILAHSDLSGGAEKWVLFFDASDVGVTRNISNIALEGNILVGLSARQFLKDLGREATPFQMLNFEAERYGPKTEGAFSIYVSGEGYDLTTSSEKIDAFGSYFSQLGCWGWPLSTVGAMSTRYVTNGRDEDVVCATEGEGADYEIHPFFDGSAVTGLAGEDVVAVSYDNDDDQMYMTILGTGTIAGHVMDQKTIFAVDYPGYNFVGTVWRGPDHGFNYNIDGFEYTGW